MCSHRINVRQIDLVYGVQARPAQPPQDLVRTLRTGGDVGGRDSALIFGGGRGVGIPLRARRDVLEFKGPRRRVLSGVGLEVGRMASGVHAGRDRDGGSLGMQGGMGIVRGLALWPRGLRRHGEVLARVVLHFGGQLYSMVGEREVGECIGIDI